MVLFSFLLEEFVMDKSHLLSDPNVQRIIDMIDDGRLDDEVNPPDDLEARLDATRR